MTAPDVDFELSSRTCPLCGPAAEAVVQVEANVDVERLGRFAFASRKPPELMHHRLVRCLSCDLLYASPAPSSQSLARLYRDAAYDSGEESRYAAATYAGLVSRLLPELPGHGGALDIGAGDGAFLRELAARGIPDAVGVEPSAAPVAAAPPDVRPRLRQQVFRAEDFQPRSLRLVTAFQTMEHVPHPLAVCQAARELLVDGGALVLVCHDRRHLVNHLLGSRSPIYDVEHLQLFSRASLRLLLQRSGYSQIRLSPVTNRYPLRYWIRLLPLPARPKAALLRRLARGTLGSRGLCLRVGNVAAVGFRAAG